MNYCNLFKWTFNNFDFLLQVFAQLDKIRSYVQHSLLNRRSSMFSLLSSGENMELALFHRQIFPKPKLQTQLTGVYISVIQVPLITVTI